MAWLVNEIKDIKNLVKNIRFMTKYSCEYFFYFRSTKYDKLVVTVSVMIVSEILHYIIGGTT
ncbi:hypothetical protein BTGOE5_55500 [Bacillus thuringiensis]|nr:hypothetical protein IIS_04824 [Bacillus cereus VD131]MCS3599599.1 hypothetical protein [Bacillus sp. JUb91]OFC92568.1 hypothetical protein BTGOE5_55500 [Bacillus thuringiensis]